MEEKFLRGYKRIPRSNRDRIWFNYKSFKQQAYVIRSGFGLSGVYPVDSEILKPTAGQPARPESDLEHVAGMMNLARAISWYYPEIVPKEHLDDFLFGAQIHEIGELESGDIPDDGKRDEKEKTFKETYALKRYLFRTAPPDEYQRGMQIFAELCEKKTEFGQTLYMIDKLEAILQAVFYEAMGHQGLLSYKEERYHDLSEQDKRHILEVKSTNIVDVWTSDMIEKGTEMNYPYLSSFVSIIVAAIEDVRGETFSWIQS